jgi:hypothetical protein
VPDESPEFSRGTVDLLKILMLTGAVIGIISVFRLWLDAGNYLFQFDYTGYDLFTKSKGYPDTGLFLYMPLAVLIASAAAIGTSILSFTRHEKIGAAAGMVLGAVVLTLTIFYVFYPESTMRLSSPTADMIAPIMMRDVFGEGIYSAVIASCFLIIGGLVILIHRKTRSRADDEE